METGLANRVSHVGQQKGSLVDAIGVLEEKIKTLESRLQQVLRIASPTLAKDNNGKPEECQVELAMFMRDQYRRVIDIATHIQNIIDRCEL